jgi:chromosome partitioning protein
LLDLSDLGDVGLGHIAARQELREMIAGLAVPGQDDMGEAPRAAAAG